MAAHGICFDFYYRPKPSQIRQNGSAAAADARLAGFMKIIGYSFRHFLTTLCNIPKPAWFLVESLLQQKLALLWYLLNSLMAGPVHSRRAQKCTLQLPV